MVVIRKGVLVMSATRRVKHIAIGLLPAVLVPLAFAAAKPWLKATLGAGMVSLLAAACALFVMGYAVYLSVRWQRCVDEVQAAGSNFAARWGTAAGSIGFVLLMMLGPFVDFMAGAISDMADLQADARTVKFAMLAGFGCVVVLQTLGMFVVNLLWWRSHR